MPIPQVSSVEQPSYTDDSVAMNDEYEYYDEGITDQKLQQKITPSIQINQITYPIFPWFFLLKNPHPHNV